MAYTPSMNAADPGALEAPGHRREDGGAARVPRPARRSHARRRPRRRARGLEGAHPALLDLQRAHRDRSVSDLPRPQRTDESICVVEEPADLIAIERSKGFAAAITSCTARCRRSTASARRICKIGGLLARLRGDTRARCPFAIIAIGVAELTHLRSWVYYVLVGVAIALGRPRRRVRRRGVRAAVDHQRLRVGAHTLPSASPADWPTGCSPGAVPAAAAPMPRRRRSPRPRPIPSPWLRQLDLAHRRTGLHAQFCCCGAAIGLVSSVMLAGARRRLAVCSIRTSSRDSPAAAPMPRSAIRPPAPPPMRRWPGRY